MEKTVEERLAAALKLNESKDLEFAAAKDAAQREADLKEAKKKGAAEAWPQFLIYAQKAATRLNNDTSHQLMLIETHELEPSEPFIKSLECSLTRDAAKVARCIFHLKADGVVTVVVLVPHSGQGTTFNVFGVEQATIEEILVGFVEQYVKARKLQR